MSRNSIDAAFLERLHRALSYNPDTGEFRWLITRGRCRAGALAGKVCANGYLYIGFEGAQWLAHRLAWVWQTGEVPAEEVDHVDRNPLNNSFLNLRAASRTLNGGNTGIWRTNTSGYRGVSWDRTRDRWAAYIWRGNRKTHLGYFDRRDDAARAYDAAAKTHFGEFASINLPVAA